MSHPLPNLTDAQFERELAYGKREGARPRRHRRGPRLSREQFSKIHGVFLSTWVHVLDELVKQQEIDREKAKA